MRQVGTGMSLYARRQMGDLLHTGPLQLMHRCQGPGGCTAPPLACVWVSEATFHSRATHAYAQAERFWQQLKAAGLTALQALVEKMPQQAR